MYCRILLTRIDTTAVKALELHFNSALDLACVYVHQLWMYARETNPTAESAILVRDQAFGGLPACIQNVSDSWISQLRLLFNEMVLCLDLWKQELDVVMTNYCQKAWLEMTLVPS